MNCYDCAALGLDSHAVAVCMDCGAGMCIDHGHVEPRWLTRTMVINREVTVEPPARSIRCATCATARQALEGAGVGGRSSASPRRVSHR
jgi:hypothetical protein